MQGPESTKRKRHREVPDDRRAAEHLANERTFLAWVRTNVALISLGLVVARLSPSLVAETAGGARRVAARTIPLGVLLVVFGALVTMLAAWRYRRVNQEIEAGLVKTDRALVWIVTLVITLLSIAAIIYMLTE